MPTRISGLGSGLDVDTLVKQSVMAKRVPIDKMKQKVTYLGWQRDAYRDMNTEMTAFMKEVQKLTLESSFISKKSNLTATDAEKVKVNPNSSAVNGSFTLLVRQIATSAAITSNAPIGATFAANGASSSSTLTINGQAVAVNTGDSASLIASKINGTTSLSGVKAIYDNLSDKMTLVSTKMGSTSNINLTETGTLLSELKITTTNSTGLNAIVNFNSSATDTTVQSNSFMMNNINFTLLKDPAANGGPYTINGTVGTDVDNIVSTIKGVFDKYNALIDKVNGKLNEPKYRTYTPLTDDQKKNMKEADIKLWEDKAKSGLMQRESVLSGGLAKMRRFLSDSVSGIPAGQYQSLVDIGITGIPSSGKNSLEYLDNGKIYINEDKLRTALTNSPDQVAALFTKDGARDANGNLTTWTDAGVGTRLYEVLKSDVIKGLTEKTQLVPTKSYLLRQIDDYTSRINDGESGLSRYEQQLYSRYAQLEKTLSQLNAQSTYLQNFTQQK